MSDIASSASDPQFMLSLSRGLAVLEAFAAVYPDVTVARLTRETSLPRSVVTRCLHTLVQLGYIAAEGRSYFPRPRLLRLADIYLTDGALPAIVQPVLDSLRDDISESCSAGVLDGDELVYIARAIQPRLMSISLHAGSRLPAWCTSMGRVLLAARRQSDIDAYLLRVEIVARTEKSVVDHGQLRSVLARADRDGYVLVDQEVERGLRSIAVPIRDHRDVVIAALNVGTSTSQCSLADMKKRVLPRLLAAAQQIESAYRSEFGPAGNST